MINPDLEQIHKDMENTAWFGWRRASTQFNKEVISKSTFEEARKFFEYNRSDDPGIQWLLEELRVAVMR